MVLDTVNKYIEVVLGEAHFTRGLDVTAFWADTTDTAFTLGCADSITTGATAITIVTSPGIGVYRLVRGVFVVNTDTSWHNVSIRLYNALTGNRRVFARNLNLAVGSSLVYFA